MMTENQTNRDEKRILIAGGGTGGHVYPALATIEALKEKGQFEFLYVGGKNGIETRIVPKHSIPMETIWISGIARSLTFKNLLFPLKIMMSLIKSWKIVKKFKPHAAVGTGGYVSGPILFVAAKMGVPVLIQEQDVYPGLTTRLLAKYADCICLSFEGADKHFQEYLNKLVLTGNPVRKGIAKYDRKSAINEMKLEENKLTLFVFGGSQGARSINLAMIDLLPKLLKKYDFQILWQTGESQYASVTERFTDTYKNAHVMPYVQKMDAAYAVSDVVLSRAGAITLAELALVGKSAVLVPYPYAAGNHQEHNSRIMEEAGAAIMVLEGENWETKLQEALEKLFQNETLRHQQSAAWKTLARPNAAELISDEVLKLIKTRNQN